MSQRRPGSVEFNRSFGGLWVDSTLGYAVAQFFLNGGADALIVRVCGAGGAAARGTVGGSPLRAANAGAWGNSLEVTVDFAGRRRLQFVDQGQGDKRRERYSATCRRRECCRFRDESAGARLKPRARGGADVPTMPIAGTQTLSGGADGSNISDDDISALRARKPEAGPVGARNADMFSLLCIPPLLPAGEIGRETRAAAANYCVTRRALFIVDPPAAWTSAGAAISGVDTLDDADVDARSIFPRLRASDPLQGGAAADFAPCGADRRRHGPHRRGARRLEDAADWTQCSRASPGFRRFDRRRQNSLNPLGVNCLRAMPAIGPVVWGARTFSA